MLCTVALLSTMAACGRNSNKDSQINFNSGNIVGGTAVAAGKFPSVVSLVRDQRRFCTGNLIAVNKIATAAHCVTTFDYDSEEAVTEMINKVIVEIVQVMPTKKFADFMALSPADQERLFRASTRSVLTKDTAGIQVYFGQGTAEHGSKVNDARDIVATVSMPEEAMDFAVAQLMNNTIFKTPADAAATYKEKFDVAFLALKQDVTDVQPVPLINADEHQESVFIGGDVQLVGFGLKADPRLLEGSAQKLEDLRKEIAAEKDVAKKELLRTELLDEQIFFLNLMSEYNASGNKNTVLMKLENYDHETVVLKRKTATFQGACFGDSGGPAFVTTPNGQLRQLGVIVTVDVCGNKTMVSPLFDR